MSFATTVTVAILSLALVLALLAWAGGAIWQRSRRDLDAARREREAFDQGADTDAKMRKLGTRARLGR